jgi:LmbE family N-acetylglucosaminyl deacetylase
MFHYYKDRHPDHYNGSKLIYESAFLSGLHRVDTGQEIHRPSKIMYYMGGMEFKPTFISDITEQFERKMKAVFAYETQFNPDDPSYPPTRLATKEHHWKMDSKNRYYGSQIGKKYGEAFLIRGKIEVIDITEINFNTF